MEFSNVRFRPIANSRQTRHRGRMLITSRAVALALFLGCSARAFGAELPRGIVEQFPAGYVALSSAKSVVDRTHEFYIVATASRTEKTARNRQLDAAPTRPLLIFRRRPDGRFALAGRNDHVVLRADDGGIAANGCDPFEERKITTKGRYFTVEHGVACGAHWTDYVTFRFDPTSKNYIFASWRFQSWSMNRSNNSDAEALVPDPPRVVRSRGKRISFAGWQRPASE